MKKIKAYTLDELCNKNKEILLITNKGTEISIKEKDGITIILFPFGNEIEDVRLHGYLQQGIAVIEEEM